MAKKGEKPKSKPKEKAESGFLMTKVNIRELKTVRKLVVQKTSGIGHSIFHSVEERFKRPEGLLSIGGVTRIVWQGLEQADDAKMWEVEEGTPPVVQSTTTIETDDDGENTRETVQTELEVEET